MCIMACPYGAINQHPTEKVALKCDRCRDRETPSCVESCPNKALLFTEVNTFSDERAIKVVAALVAAD